MSKPKILFETKEYMVVDKPAGMLAYPLPGSKEETIGEVMGGVPVHRLDRDTSGILILAKNENAKTVLKQIFKERNIKKIYTALVWGKVEPKQGTINMPLGRGSKDRLKVVPKTGGRESVTEYNVTEYLGDKTLLNVNLKTGRTHQIRVHFSAIGHPVVGDKKYSTKNTNLGRQFLHAKMIEFMDPFSGEAVTVESQLPQDLEKFLKSIK